MAATRVSDPLIDALEAEWPHLCEDTRRACERWSGRHPVLRAVVNFDGVVEGLRAGGDDALHAVLVVASGPDAGDAQIARRLVLQVMLPAVCGMIRGKRGVWAEADEVIEAMWISISSYPLSRRTSVAANLYFEALNLVTSAHPGSGEVVDELNEDVDMASVPTPRNASDELIEVMVWALERGVIERSEAQLLVDRYCPSSAACRLVKDGSEAVSAAMGLSAATVRKRCSRAVRKVRRAIEVEGYAPISAALL